MTTLASPSFPFVQNYFFCSFCSFFSKQGSGAKMKMTGFTVIVLPPYIELFYYFCLFTRRALQVIPDGQALVVLEDRRLGPNI